MSIVGIDFGNDTCVISVARAGGVETATNDCSHRLTPSVIAFGEKQRFMGADAKQKRITNISRTFYGFKMLIGRTFRDPFVQSEILRLPYKVSEGPDGGILIHVPGNEHPVDKFTPEQIAAMLLTNLREMTEVYLNNKIKDVVISVPTYFKDRQRRGLLDAATIAGLNVLRVINDNTAAGLTFGFYKNDLPAPEEKPKIVFFVDYGHSKIEVSACAFCKGKMSVLASTYNNKTGGSFLDELLANHFADDFKTRYKLDATTKPKAFLKLLTEVEKIKKNMSSVSSMLSIKIECFMEDTDVTGTMNREQFEELAAPHFEIISQTLRDCLKSSNVELEDIDQVEIVGGSTRIPMVKSIIEKVLGKTPQTTLNTDEAISRGCAIMCAILSPTSRAREFAIEDVKLHPIKLVWRQGIDGSLGGNADVFTEHQKVPFSKLITFVRNKSFKFRALYNDGFGGDDEESIVGDYEINVGDEILNELEKIKVKVRIDSNGLFNVPSATFSRKIEPEPKMEVEESVPAPEVKNGTEDAKPEEKPSEPGVDTPATSQPQESKKEKVLTKVHHLCVESHCPGSLDCDKLSFYTQLEERLAREDINERNRISSGNNLETTIYSLRSSINGELAPYMLSEDSSKALEDLQVVCDWLYDDGFDSSQQVYETKSTEINALCAPAMKRLGESHSRKPAITKLTNYLRAAKDVTDAFYKGEEHYDHLDKDNISKVVDYILEVEGWMNEQCANIDSLPTWKDPTVSTIDFVKKLEAAEKFINPIIKAQRKVIPPPVPAKEEVDPASTKVKEDETMCTSPENGKSMEGEPPASVVEESGPSMDVD